jgi:hypothetical protein
MGMSVACQNDDFKFLMEGGYCHVGKVFEGLVDRHTFYVIVQSCGGLNVPRNARYSCEASSLIGESTYLAQKIPSLIMQ